MKNKKNTYVPPQSKAAICNQNKTKQNEKPYKQYT